MEKKHGKHEHTDVGVAIVMTPAWVSGKDDQSGSRLLIDGVSLISQATACSFCWAKPLARGTRNDTVELGIVC